MILFTNVSSAAQWNRILQTSPPPSVFPMKYYNYVRMFVLRYGSAAITVYTVFKRSKRFINRPYTQALYYVRTRVRISHSITATCHTDHANLVILSDIYIYTNVLCTKRRNTRARRSASRYLYRTYVRGRIRERERLWQFIRLRAGRSRARKTKPKTV